MVQYPRKDVTQWDFIIEGALTNATLSFSPPLWASRRDWRIFHSGGSNDKEKRGGGEGKKRKRREGKEERREKRRGKSLQLNISSFWSPISCSLWSTVWIEKSNKNVKILESNKGLLLENNIRIFTKGNNNKYTLKRFRIPWNTIYMITRSIERISIEYCIK